MMNEVWKDVVGYEGCYQVSNFGRIRSTKRVTFDGRKRKEMIRAPSYDPDGYLTVNLSKDGISKTQRIHRLVATAFIPNPNGYSQINHKDENKSNNCVENLEWCTCEYNLKYGNRLRKVSGENHPRAKLTYEIVKEIRRSYKPRDPEYGAHALSRKYNVGYNNIGKIVRNEIWKFTE